MVGEVFLRSFFFLLPSCRHIGKEKKNKEESAFMFVHHSWPWPALVILQF
jgi:hypothetical protein